MTARSGASGVVRILALHRSLAQFERHVGEGAADIDAQSCALCHRQCLLPNPPWANVSRRRRCCQSARLSRRLSDERSRRGDPGGSLSNRRPKRRLRRDGAIRDASRHGRHQRVRHLLLLGRQARIERPKRVCQTRFVVGPDLGELRLHLDAVDGVHRRAAVLPGIGDRLVERLRILAHDSGKLIPLRLLRRGDFEFGLQESDAAVDQLARHHAKPPW